MRATAGHSILRATDFVFIGASGRPVVQDSSFSLHISAIEFIPAHIPEMSESSRVSSIFPALGRLDNPVRPKYDLDVVIHPNKEVAHRPHGDALGATPPPFSGMEYLERYPTCLDVECFRRMQTGWYEFPPQNSFFELRNTAVAGWASRRNH